MNVLHVTMAYYPAVRYGGPIRSVQNLVRAQSAAGHQCVVCTTNSDGLANTDAPVGTPVTRDGATVFYFNSPGLRYYGYAPKMRSWLKRHVTDFDIVHIHGVWNFPERYAAAACRRRNVPYVLSARGMLKRGVIQEKHPFLKRCYLRVLDRGNLKQARVIHYTTDAEQDASIHLSDGPGWVVPNAVSLNHATTVRDEGKPVSPFKQYILFVGRVCWVKNIDTLIRAFACLEPDFPELGLVIAGPDDEGLASGYGKLASQLGVHARVHFAGLVAGDRLASLYRGAAMCVLPSFSENFGHSVVEALGYGVPVVASEGVDVASLPEIAACVKRCPARVPDLAPALREVLKDLDDWRRRAAEGEELVNSLFAPEHVAAEMVKLYESALGKDT